MGFRETSIRWWGLFTRIDLGVRRGRAGRGGDGKSWYKVGHWKLHKAAYGWMQAKFLVFDDSPHCLLKYLYKFLFPTTLCKCSLSVTSLLFFPLTFNVGFLACKRRHFIVVSAYISVMLMISYVEHLFMYLLSIYMDSFLGKCLL